MKWLLSNSWRIRIRTVEEVNIKSVAPVEGKLNSKTYTSIQDVRRIKHFVSLLNQKFDRFSPKFQLVETQIVTHERFLKSMREATIFRIKVFLFKVRIQMKFLNSNVFRPI